MSNVGQGFLDAQLTPSWYWLTSLASDFIDTDARQRQDLRADRSRLEQCGSRELICRNVVEARVSWERAFGTVLGGGR